MKERKLYLRLRRMAFTAARVFKLPLAAFATNEALLYGHMWGWCWTDTGVIQMRLRGWSGKLLPEYRLIDTLAHELAHLVEPSHNRTHKVLSSAVKVFLQRNVK